MTSPPGSPGAAAWRLEAEAVVADIVPHVSAAALSSLSGDSTGTFLNITTLEGRRLTVRLTAAGFSICGEGHDTNSSPRTDCSSIHVGGDGCSGGGRVYETPYALLHEVSPAYTAAFGQSLADRLGQLVDGAVEDEGEEEEVGQDVDGDVARCEEVDRPGDGGAECKRKEGSPAVFGSESSTT